MIKPHAVRGRARGGNSDDDVINVPLICYSARSVVCGIQYVCVL